MDGKINLGGKSSFGKKDHSVLTVNIWRLDLIPFHVVVPPKHFSEYNYKPTANSKHTTKLSLQLTKYNPFINEKI